MIRNSSSLARLHLLTIKKKFKKTNFLDREERNNHQILLKVSEILDLVAKILIIDLDLTFK